MVERTRTLGFWIAFSMGLGTMIAAGIFSLSGQAVADIGSSAVVAFVIAALVAGVTAASYSEFASIYSENGGGYLFSSRTFDNELLVYGVGVSLFLGYTGTTAFYLATMDEWFQKFIIPEGIPIPHGLVGIAAAVLLGTLNARGTEESGSFQLIITSAKVAVLIAFVGGALNFAGPAKATADFANSFQWETIDIASTAGTAFITFFGFSAIAASAGEIIEPRKTVPKAIAASMVTVTVLYIFVIVAMVNTPQTWTLDGQTFVRSEVLQAGETAMGQVAQVFLGGIGQYVIVAGAIFSMVSASNASILAGSGIGFLMGRQGQGPRRFSRIHPDYETPFWSVATVTGTIVMFIAAFIYLFGEGSVVHLGLPALTNFATMNLLAPLAVVNLALIFSRRRYPDIDRPFSVPLGSVLPIVGIVANVALIGFLAVKGMAINPGEVPETAQFVLSVAGITLALKPAVLGLLVGVVMEVGLVGAYLSWGGRPDVEELITEAAAPEAVTPSATKGGSGIVNVEAGPATPENDEEGEVAEQTIIEDGDRFRVLVPLARVHRAPEYAHLAAEIGKLYDDEPIVQFLNVTQVPEQTPTSAVEDVATERTKRLSETLAEVDIDVPYIVEGHICQDLAFDILQTAREDRADRIVMGYPERHPDVTESVESQAPCDTLFVSGLGEDIDTSVVTVGTGGGPHHEALLGLVAGLAQAGSEIHVVNVDPRKEGTREALDKTVAAFPDTDVQVHNVSSDDVAHGLVSTAADNGGVLMIGASRTRLLRRWVFGSTPDRVIQEADEYGVPVLVYASSRSMVERVEDVTFPVYRYLRRRTA